MPIRSFLFVPLIFTFVATIPSAFAQPASCPIPAKSSSESWKNLSISDAVKIQDLFAARIQIEEPTNCSASRSIEGRAKILKRFGTKPANAEMVSYNIYNGEPCFSKGQTFIAFIGTATQGASYNLNITYPDNAVSEKCLSDALEKSHK